MQVLVKSIHVINYVDAVVEFRNAPEGFNRYIESLVKHIIENQSTRKFKVRSQYTEVVSSIKELTNGVIVNHSIVNGPSNENFEAISKRLLLTEVDMQDKISRLNQKIQKGSLVQALVHDEILDKNFYILTKVEHVNFIDDSDFISKTGFEENDKKIWKSCLFEIGDDLMIEEALVYLNSTAKYWHNEFLEVDELLSDELNTSNAYKYVDKVLRRYIKRESEKEYTILHNNLLGYLRRNEHVDYLVMIDEVFGQYATEEIEDDVFDNTVNKLREIPDNNSFDLQFNSVPKSIKLKSMRKMKVSLGIELRISEHINNLEDKINSKEYNGIKYLMIETDNEETYNSFI